MTTFVHISDLHFGRTDPPLIAALHHSLKGIQPNLVVISGDLTQRARRNEFLAARAFLEELQYPFLVIPGNHDIPAYNLAERFFKPWQKWHRYLGYPLEPIIDTGDFFALGIHTVRRSSSFTDWSRGRINEAQSNVAASLLKNQPANKLRILVIHHPFWLPDRHRRRHIIGNRDQALEIFRQAEVDLILSGHVHLAYTQIFEGLIVSHSGTTLSNRLLADSQNSFNIICGNRQELTIETRHWNKVVFEPTGSRSFIRSQDNWSEIFDKVTRLGSL